MNPLATLGQLQRCAGRLPLPGAPMRQRGIALIIGLIILVVLALLGASAYSVATQDERIAGNARDHSRAMDAAETMLRYCEYFIQTTSPPFDGSVPGMLPAPAAGSTWVGDNPNTNWSAVSTASLPPAMQVNPEWSQPPQCIAESYAFTGSVRQGGLPGQAATMKVAHVTARGYGLNTNTAVTLVSYVAFY